MKQLVAPAFLTGVSAVDPVARLQFEGANNSTTFTDDFGHTFTAGGDAKISTAQAAAGSSSSGLFNGTNAYLSSPSSTDWNFGTGNLRIAFYMRFASLTGFQTLVTRAYGVDGGFLLQTGNGDGKIVLYVWQAGPSLVTVASDAGSTVNADQWYHFEWTRTGSSNILKRDGAQVGSGTNSQNLAPAGTPALYIGAGNGAAPPTANWFNGYLDQLEIYKGAF